MLAVAALVSVSGCHLILPDISHQPRVHNPFPQLSRVAVAPFFNQSEEPTVDGRDFALAYYAELQAVPGFEVVPLGVVEETILQHQIDLASAGEARRLARLLGVDAVVIGSVTDFTPYYPPRCGMRVEWYAANPGFHEIPAGYGLPWGTPEEEFIPESLVFEAEMALAKAQLASQTPDCAQPPLDMPPVRQPPETLELLPPAPGASPAEHASDSESPATDDDTSTDITRTAYEMEIVEEALPTGDSSRLQSSLPADAAPYAPLSISDAIGASRAMPPGASPAPCLTPAPFGAAPPACLPNNGPVMTHTRIYHGHDPDFTEALANYYYFRNDARFGGWQNYLQRSDDFVRFCCHLHIAEMLSARGGADETRVVWRWSDCR